jgi:hypothetical protein
MLLLNTLSINRSYEFFAGIISVYSIKNRKNNTDSFHKYYNVKQQGHNEKRTTPKWKYKQQT